MKKNYICVTCSYGRLLTYCYVTQLKSALFPYGALNIGSGNVLDFSRTTFLKKPLSRYYMFTYFSAWQFCRLCSYLVNIKTFHINNQIILFAYRKYWFIGTCDFVDTIRLFILDISTDIGAKKYTSVKLKLAI